MANMGLKETAVWDFKTDPDNPINWPKWKKWAIPLFASLITFISGINGTALTAATTEINNQFRIDDSEFPNSYWLVTAWNLGAALAPLFALPLMETFGVRYPYPAVYILFIVFVVPQAVARSFATLIVTRVLSGACAGILENITGGIISDIWQDEHSRSLPMAIYLWSLFAGVSFGPVFGGAISSVANWRWIFYAQLILYGSFLPLVLAVPETRGEVIWARKVKRAKAEGADIAMPALSDGQPPSNMMQEALIRPLHMLFTEWVVFSFTLWSAFAFGIILMFTQSLPQVFIALYSWSEWQTGVLQIAIVIGLTLGLLATIPQNIFYKHNALRHEQRGTTNPEARLYLSIPGSLFGMTCGLFLFGWTSYASIPWIVPAIGLVMVGFGIFTIFCA